MSFFASQGGNLYGSQSWPDRRTRRPQMAHQGFIWAAITKLTDANITSNHPRSDTGRAGIPEKEGARTRLGSRFGWREDHT
jgi:hypothetical protein